MSTASGTVEAVAAAREAFGRTVGNIRPKLLRYAARMTGSAVDGEDVVQEALARAFFLLPTTEVANLEAWLMTIVHNKAIDLMRGNARRAGEPLDEHPVPAGDVAPLEARETAELALSVYLQLSPLQRSCVILKDVMGYSLAELSEMLDISVGAVKAALHRGRDNVRKVAATIEEGAPPPLAEPEARLLQRYVDRFNARDFDAVRAMLSDDVRLDLVEREKRRGALRVAHYFHNYDAKRDWQLSVGVADGRPAILVADRAGPARVDYIMLVTWKDGAVAAIRDYRYARHVMAEVAVAA